MPEDESSGGFIVLPAEKLVAQSLLQQQTKKATFLVQNIDIYEVI